MKREKSINYLTIIENMLIKFIYDKYYYYYKNSKKYNRLFKSKPQLIIILPFPNKQNL